MKERMYAAIIDACALLDRRFRWPWITRLYLWAWAREQEVDVIWLYDAWKQRWYRGR